MSALTQYALDPARRDLGQRIHAALVRLLPDGASLSLAAADISRLLEQPPESKLGDYALPCFRFAKELRLSPQATAQALAAGLQTGGWLGHVEVANAFLNLFTVKSELARAVLPAVLSGKSFELPRENAAHAATRIMVEYSQPNTHKEFHVGHVRNVCLGNALVRLFRYNGYQVTATNYYGDEGTHIATCLWYIIRFGKEPPAVGRGEWLGRMYAESKRQLAEANETTRTAMAAEISAIHHQIEAKRGDAYELWCETRQWSLDDFAAIYDWLDVHFDVLFYESELTEEAQELVDEYLKRGVFVEDQGAVGVDLKPFKLGFSILRKRDGNTLYATKDLVLARRKFEKYAIDRSIYVVADEQNHHFKQVFKVLELMGFKQANRSHHLSYGMVVLPDGKMSSRSGTAVAFSSLRELMLTHLGEFLKKYESEWTPTEIAETAHRLCDGAIKYGMIATDPAKEIVFNLEDWLSFDGNSGPYLMYSYARTRSILRKAEAQGFLPDAAALGELTHPTEHELLRFLYDFNDVVGAATEGYKPSLLATHLYHMSKAFNRFYADLSILKAESETLRAARLALTAAFARTLFEGLALLGIRPPERM